MSVTPNNARITCTVPPANLLSCLFCAVSESLLTDTVPLFIGKFIVFFPLAPILVPLPVNEENIQKAGLGWARFHSFSLSIPPPTSHFSIFQAKIKIWQDNRAEISPERTLKSCLVCASKSQVLRSWKTEID